MKKKLLAGVAIATLVVGGLMIVRQAPQSALSDLQMENLETLTASEGSAGGCRFSPGDVCFVICKDTSGKVTTFTLVDYKNF